MTHNPCCSPYRSKRVPFAVDPSGFTHICQHAVHPTRHADFFRTPKLMQLAESERNKHLQMLSPITYAPFAVINNPCVSGDLSAPSDAPNIKTRGLVAARLTRPCQSAIQPGISSANLTSVLVSTIILHAAHTFAV